MLSHIDNLLSGIGGAEIVMTVARIATGTFFVFSGYNKLFNKGRHQSLIETFKADHIPFIRFNQWWVPSVEFVGGLAIVIGLLTVPAAMALIILLTVAMARDGYNGSAPTLRLMIQIMLMTGYILAKSLTLSC